MSLYVEWLNKTKSLATSEWLTDNQRKAFNDLLTKWQAETLVCLCGPAGCGKTFIGRLLHKESGYSYVTSLREVKTGEEYAVVDGEDYTRLMRPSAQLLGLKRVVVLMRHPPQDPIPRAEIQLDEHDVRQFQHNLTRYGVLQVFRTNADGTDLGKILRDEAVARGGGNVT